MVKKNAHTEQLGRDLLGVATEVTNVGERVSRVEDGLNKVEYRGNINTQLIIFVYNKLIELHPEIKEKADEFKATLK